MRAFIFRAFFLLFCRSSPSFSGSGGAALSTTMSTMYFFKERCSCKTKTGHDEDGEEDWKSRSAAADNTSAEGYTEVGHVTSRHTGFHTALGDTVSLDTFTDSSNLCCTSAKRSQREHTGRRRHKTQTRVCAADRWASAREAEAAGGLAGKPLSTGGRQERTPRLCRWYLECALQRKSDTQTIQRRLSKTPAVFHWNCKNSWAIIFK